jgi:hypothetical protein
MKNNLFSATIINVSDDDKLIFHFINIKDYEESFKDLIDKYIVSIYNNTFDNEDILLVKEQLKEWFEEKKGDENKKAGFVAEFICHLYINNLNYKQHFIFENLEEKGSMKKGFDGLYKMNDEMWLYESKSSLSTTISANHNSNISEAYRDIRDKLQGKKVNKHGNPISPWSNAVHHVSVADIDNNETLIQNLKEFRNRFINKDFENIKNFNVIPSSTIFLEDKWGSINSSDLEIKLKSLTSKYEYNKMNIICINKKSIDSFIEYINDI